MVNLWICGPILKGKLGWQCFAPNVSRAEANAMIKLLPARLLWAIEQVDWKEHYA